MTDATLESAAVERVGRLMLQFLDLSGDLERNRNDTAHAQDGKTVTYAMDASVIEVFLNCRDARGRSASLHTAQWRIGGRLPAAWDSYAAQTALVTTGYLLGGALPGQRDEEINMSGWHRKEMVRRLTPIVAGQAGRVASDFAQARRRYDEGQRYLRKDAAAGAARPHEVDDEFLQDLEAYRSASPSPGEIDTYSATRLALRVIADDRLVEPLQQMERLVSNPIRSRIRTLEGSLSAAQAHIKDMAKAAGPWFKALQAECTLRGIKVVTEREDNVAPEEHSRPEDSVRTAGALWDDARTVALMQWAAARRPRDNRLVFVTADNVVFDAYRRWYSDLRAGNPSNAEPFFMRRLRQFAPGYNLINAGLAHGGRFSEIFDEMSRGLAMLSVPLALSRPHSANRSTMLDRERERTALRLLDARPITADPAFKSFFEAIRRNATGDREGKFTGLLDEWRNLERAALGQATDEVERRTATANRWQAELSADLEPHGAFERLISKVVGRIYDGTLQVTLLFARDVIERWRPPAGRNSVRAPIALRMPVRLGTEIDLGAALMSRLERPPGTPANVTPPKLVNDADWKLLFDRPEMVFAIAAALSMAGGDWGEAVNFAEYAVQIVRRQPPGESAMEILYLAALAKRLRIGDIGPALSEKRANEIRTLHVQACELNDECLAYHKRHSTSPTLMELRTYSERAASWLFFASALHAGGSADLNSKGKGYISLSRPEAKAAIERAEDDLRRCFDIDRADADRSDHDTSTFRRRLKRQIYTNAAFAYLLREIWELETPRESLFSAHNPRAVERARDINLRDRGDTVMAADIHAFLALAGDRSEAKALAGMPDLQRGPNVLSLDIWVVKALKDLVNAAEAERP